MKIRTVLQPFDGQCGALLCQSLSDLAESGAEVTLLSAWGRRSGLSLIEGSLRSFRKAGGVVRVVIGVDQGGTSREALELLFDLADVSRVVHDRSRSFHPKYYIVTNGQRARLFIGSGNLTRGGLSNNYEMFTVIELLLSSDEDARFLDMVHKQIENLLADAGTVKDLSPGLIKDLVERGLVVDETRAAPDEMRSVSVGDNLFGTRSGLLGPTSAGPPPKAPPDTGPSQSGSTSAFRKTLSSNDVGATGGHQAGILIPKGDIGFFPHLNPSVANPSVWLDFRDEAGRRWRWRYIHYNNGVISNGTRDEYRITHMTPYLRERGARAGSRVEIERVIGGYRIRLTR